MTTQSDMKYVGGGTDEVHIVQTLLGTLMSSDFTHRVKRNYGDL